MKKVNPKFIENPNAPRPLFVTFVAGNSAPRVLKFT